MCFLVAIDLSAPSRSAIELSALLARATGLSPLLLHVSAGRPPLRLLADLYGLAEPLRALGSTPKLRTVQGDPASCIREQAIARGARFVVMGTRGQQSGDAPPTGSVARRVMAASEVPVIAVRPQHLAIPSAQDATPSSPVVALIDTVHPGEAAHSIARFLVEATDGHLLELPSGSRWHEGTTAGLAGPPAHLVLSIDPADPAPPWVERLLHTESTPLVLVSRHSLAWAVPNHTARG